MLLCAASCLRPTELYTAVQLEPKFIKLSKSYFYCADQDSSVGIETWLRAGRSGDRISVRARFSSPVQTGPGVHPASCTKVPDVFLGGKAAGVLR